MIFLMRILRDSIMLLLLLGIVLILVKIVLLKTGLIFTVKKWKKKIIDSFHVYQFYKIPEFNENHQENQLHRRFHSYLNSLSSIENSDFTNLFAGKKPGDIILRLDRNKTINDEFLGARVCWINDESSLILKIQKSDKRRILGSYLQHIHTVTEDLHHDLNLFINIARKNNRRWRSIPFMHPCKFDNISMETDLKEKVKSDLESFLKGKPFYHNRLGRVWKRSYLLYGAPGTEKSSFVAAMANFLNFLKIKLLYCTFRFFNRLPNYNENFFQFPQSPN